MSKNNSPINKSSSSPSFVIVPAEVMSLLPTYAHATTKPTGFASQQGVADLAMLRPYLDGMAPDEVLTPRLDAEVSAHHALAVHDFVTQTPSVRERFEELARVGQFERGNLDRLRAAAFAVLLTRTQVQEHEAFASGARVPAAVLEAAGELEARMQRLCEYWFSGDPEIAPLLDALRPGSGHSDLAADLVGYANIYAKRPAVVKKDGLNFRPTDEADARRMAEEISAHLVSAAAAKGRDAFDLHCRAWTALVRIYDEVQAAGRFVCRADPHAHERFPSLFTAGRNARAKKKATATTPPPEIPHIGPGVGGLPGALAPAEVPSIAHATTPAQPGK